MKQFSFLFILFIASIHLSAQTKEIAFKSHSGSHDHFAATVRDGLFDTDSDFGVAPVKNVKSAELDSVIFISDSVAIMVTSEYCRWEDYHNTEKGPENLWKAGSKLVYNHPLFSKKHSLDSIKNIIKQQYHFRNPVDKVVFVGYDNGDEPEYFLAPVVTGPGNNNDQSPFGSQFVMILGLIVGLSLAGAWVTWKYGQLKAS